MDVFRTMEKLEECVMNDKESALQLKEQIKIYSDFIEIVWDALNDNVLIDDDKDNVDLMTEVFFKLVRIACVYDGNKELFEELFEEKANDDFDSVHETLSIISDFLDEVQSEDWDEEFSLLEAFEVFAEVAYKSCLKIKNENDESEIIFVSKELQEYADDLASICNDAWNSINGLEDKINELIQKIDMPEEVFDLVEKYREFVEKIMENLNTYISLVNNKNSTEDFEFLFAVFFGMGLGVLASECTKDEELFFDVSFFMADEEVKLPDDFYSFYDNIEGIDHIAEQYYYEWDNKMSLVSACKSFHFRYVNLLKMSRNGTNMDVIAKRSREECGQLLKKMEKAQDILNFLLE